ncbi:MAG TPA: hypothetical protein DD727_00825 [Clostridiales bacterium]|nr:hypothetical protein [Clostridiales bacterium]
MDGYMNGISLREAGVRPDHKVRSLTPKHINNISVKAIFSDVPEDRSVIVKANARKEKLLYTNRPFALAD